LPARLWQCKRIAFLSVIRRGRYAFVVLLILVLLPAALVAGGT
jgi:hypothetical protein